ncbi:MAG: aminotransferase class V-fold PLP-dependent enzyme [Ruminococcaceae bacterium]|nr:aminotransferase class V-fold PLP-dependent enzyme [Oscillospiraceae bacterium]
MEVFGLELVYLDHAATSWPKPRAVGAAMLRAMTEAGGNPGRAGHMLAMRASSLVYGARCTAAEFFGSDAPENVLFYPNATYAVNAVLHGLALGGKRVLISELEHNAVIRPLYCLQQSAGVAVDVYPVFGGGDGMLSDEEIVSGIRARLTRDTALVCACHASNVCGAVLPIRGIGALCRAARIPFLVDASQSAGVYDIDMSRDGIDYLCTAGHKALLGPQGSGLLLIGEQAQIPAAGIQGGNGVASLSPEMPDFLPEALEAGTLSVPAIAGLRAGIDDIGRVGIGEIRENCHMLYRRLLEMLDGLPGVTVYRGGIARGCVLSFNVRNMPCTRCAELLAAEGICVRAGFHCTPLPHRAFGTSEEGTVRVSVGWGSAVRDTERFYRAMQGICRDVR